MKPQALPARGSGLPGASRPSPGPRRAAPACGRAAPVRARAAQRRRHPHPKPGEVGGEAGSGESARRGRGRPAEERAHTSSLAAGFINSRGGFWSVTSHLSFLFRRKQRAHTSPPWDKALGPGYWLCVHCPVQQRVIPLVSTTVLHPPKVYVWGHVCVHEHACMCMHVHACVCLCSPLSFLGKPAVNCM